MQNNGTSSRTISSTITICNLTDDPECADPTTSTLSRSDITPEGIETFTYGYAFQPSKEYFVTLITGENNSYENDLKRYIFTTTDSDVTTTTTSVSGETCPVEEIYGTDADATLLLRHFRDTVLIKSTDGKELIKLYYELSPAIVKTIKEDAEYRKRVKLIIDEILSFSRTDID